MTARKAAVFRAGHHSDATATLSRAGHGSQEDNDSNAPHGTGVRSLVLQGQALAGLKALSRRKSHPTKIPQGDSDHESASQLDTWHWGALRNPPSF